MKTMHERFEEAKNIALKKNVLEQVSTKELVDELKEREGVEVTIAAPYEDTEVKVNGPATVLVVID